MTISQKTFSKPEGTNKQFKPLMIGCSGGGGHISAIQGINGFLKETFRHDVVLTDHSPVLYDQKPPSPIKDQITTGLKITHTPYISAPIRAVMSVSPFPVLPTKKSIDEEINALSRKEQNPDGTVKKRQYIDMLLDAHPAGYESAAIWNVLQRQDETQELKKLIDYQGMSDSTNYDSAFQYIADELTKAARARQPFTEIISTQAMSLPALCNVVYRYNQWLKKPENIAINAPKIVIHQYMTDLPTSGAVHFFNSLQSLTPHQQRQMKLYAVGLNQKTLNHFFPRGHKFSEVIDIPAKDNPMVRPGFKHPDFDNSAKFNTNVTLHLAENQSFDIPANEKIASIMLGSQAGNDTYEYIESLLQNGMEKVFVFGGMTNPNLHTKIQKLLDQKTEYQGRIIPLGNQNDKEISALMTRSNMLVIRGGGLSVMEQLAMNHHKDQTVFIHHANSSQENLTSGIRWEDENVNTLMETLTKQGIHCKKTSPERAIRDIAEASLIGIIKNHNPKIDNEEALEHLKLFSTSELKVFNVSSGVISSELVSYFKVNELSANDDLATIKSILERTTQFFKAIDHPKSNESLKTIANLNKILNNDSITANKRLYLFDKAFEENRANLNPFGNALIYKIIEHIKLILAQYFDMFSKRLTPQQELRLHMKEIKLGTHGLFAKGLSSTICTTNNPKPIACAV